jgi:hypothetical protein
VGAREMSAYLILLIVFLLVALVMRMLLIKQFKIDVQNQEYGVVMIAGSLALGVLILGFYVFLGIGILDVLGIVDGYRFFCHDWQITEAICRFSRG